MSANRSNYPRLKSEEEVIENYRPWQWCLMICAALAPSILKFWLPSLTTKFANYQILEFGAEFVGTIVLVVCPFLFGKGSLMRAAVDRIREPSTAALLVLGMFASLLQIVPLLFHRHINLLGGGLIFGLYKNHLWTAWIIFSYAISVLHSVAHYYFFLLIFTVPRDSQRLKLVCATIASTIGFGMSGSYMFAQVFPMQSRFLQAPSSMTAWYFESILNPIAYFVTLWLIDRMSFPSFRPVILMFGISVARGLFFSQPTDIEGMVVHLVCLTAIFGLALSYCPDELRLSWKGEEALYTE